MVFAGDLDRLRFPVRARLWGVFIGTLAMGAVVTALVSPRTIAASLPLLGVGILTGLIARGRLGDIRPSFSAGGALTLAFLGLGLLSAFWAFKPLAVFPAVLTALFYVAVCAAAAAALLNEPRADTYHIAEGLWLGLLVGLVYLTIEIFSHQAIKLTLYKMLDVPKAWLRPPSNFKWNGDELVGIALVDLTRSIAPIVMLLWSGLLALRPTAPGGRTRLWSAILYLVSGIVVFGAEHETSKVAFVVATAVFALASWRPLLGDKLLKIGWVVACLAVIPATIGLHRLELHKAPQLQMSFRHRILIWNHTAEESLKAPLLGIGAGMMYMLDPSGVKMTDPNELSDRAPHAHNIYLQTWFELGAAGAALLTLIGLALLERIRKLGPYAAPYGQATFVSAMVMAAASYGMWQPWFIAMFAMTVVMFAVALRANRSEFGGGDARAD